MTKKNLFLFALLITLTAYSSVQAANKKKPFYDSKSQIIGISGDYDTLCLRGFEKKLFYNAVPIVIDLPTPEKKKKGFSDEQIEEITKQLQNQNIAQKILDFLFLDKDGKPSADLLNKRAVENAQFVDYENADVASISTESIIQDDWKPLLQNNYIYLEKQVEDFSDFIIYKVDFDKDFIERPYNYMTDINAYNNVTAYVTYLYSGAEKTENHEKFQRKLSENCPPFAIRGQLIGRNPARARIGSGSGLNIGDMVTIYRQGMDATGNMFSRRVSRARVNAIDENESQMFFIGGTKGSYKDGDMVVLTPDKKMGVGIYANYSLGKFYGVSATWDWILNVTRAGFSGRMLVQAKADFASYSKEYKDAFNIELKEAGGPSVNPPLFLNLGVGYGLTWTLLGRFEIMPYAMAQFEYARFFKKDKNQGDYDLDAYGIRIPAGVRFDINIAYPVKFSFGAEYGYVVPISSNKNASYSADSKTLTVGYKSFVKDMLKVYDKGKKRDAVNFYAGIRWVF